MTTRVIARSGTARQYQCEECGKKSPGFERVSCVAEDWDTFHPALCLGPPDEQIVLDPVVPHPMDALPLRAVTERTITLNVSEAIFKRLRGAMNARMMSGSAFGILDEFMEGFIRRLDHGETEWTPQQRPEKERKPSPE